MGASDRVARKTAGSTTDGSEFLYDADRRRIMQLEFDAMDGGVQSHYVRKRIYFGRTFEADYRNLDFEGTAWNFHRIRIYVDAPDGIAGAVEMAARTAIASDHQAQVYHHDHLGSIESITDHGDASGNPTTDECGLPSRYSYDPWGERRDPTDWTGKPSNTTTGGQCDLTPRGYTGHEMLDGLGLAHMGGRVYDPLIGRMLSADTVVQFPNSSQSYNRFSYVRNNPLTSVDLSGWWEVRLFGFTFGNERPHLGSQVVSAVKTGDWSDARANVVSNARLAGENLLDFAQKVDHDLTIKGPIVTLVEDFGAAPIAGSSGLVAAGSGRGAMVLAGEAVEVEAAVAAGVGAAVLTARVAGEQLKPDEGSIGKVDASRAPVNEGDTGSFGELKSQSKGSGLHIYESPSNKATEKAFIKQFTDKNGRSPTPKEIAQYRKDNPSVALKPKTHEQTDTFGGRNTRAKSDADAANLDAAAERGADDVVNAGNKTGTDLSKSAEELLELQRRRSQGQ